MRNEKHFRELEKSFTQNETSSANIVELGKRIKFKYSMDRVFYIDYQGKVVFVGNDYFMIENEENKSFRMKYVSEIKEVI